MKKTHQFTLAVFGLAITSFTPFLERERAQVNRKPVQENDYWQIANDRDAPADAAKGGSKWHSCSIEKV